jgi:integrase
MVFKWGVSLQIVPPSVHQALSTVAGLKAGKCTARESEPVQPVPAEVVEKTLPHLSTVVRAMVLVQKTTGARAGEICSMKVGEIDRSGKVWVYTPASHKSSHRGHRREIFIGPQAQKILQPFLMKLDPEAFVFAPIEAVREMRQRRSERRVTPLNCGNIPGSSVKRRPRRKPGERYDVAAYRRAIARGADLADMWAKGGKVIANDLRIIPHWFPHQLRHSAGTEVRKLFGIEGAQHHLGHATLSATAIYAERNSELARKIAAQIG